MYFYNILNLLVEDLYPLLMQCITDNWIDNVLNKSFIIVYMIKVMILHASCFDWVVKSNLFLYFALPCIRSLEFSPSFEDVIKVMVKGSKFLLRIIGAHDHLAVRIISMSHLQQHGLLICKVITEDHWYLHPLPRIVIIYFTNLGLSPPGFEHPTFCMGGNA